MPGLTALINKLRVQGIRDERVLQRFAAVPRHRFVPPDKAGKAYCDIAIGIGPDQSISQPFIVARMLELLECRPEHRVLEIGTGTGYQTALLAGLCQRVVSVEIDAGLAAKARARLEALRITNTLIIAGDGFQGYRTEAPYDRIIVTAAPSEVPPELIDQLTAEGLMVIPLGIADQSLFVVKKTSAGLERTRKEAVRFVPLKAAI